jgi:uncharacterized membrane protein YvbJ
MQEYACPYCGSASTYAFKYIRYFCRDCGRYSEVRLPSVEKPKRKRRITSKHAVIITIVIITVLIIFFLIQALVRTVQNITGIPI